MNRLVEFDRLEVRVIRAQDSKGEWWRLQGKCARCGTCCHRHPSPFPPTGDKRPCEVFWWAETQGQRLASCSMHHNKPWGCALYPRNPEEPLYKGCGYHWAREEQR